MTDRIIDAPERRQLIPYSDTQVWRLEKEGKFPRRVKLGSNRVGWLESEIRAYIEKKVAERDGKAT